MAAHIYANHSLPSHGHSHGHWGPVTATLDWCEPNYQSSHFVAEPANTFSNFVTIAFALYGTRKAIENHIPKRLILGQFLFALVGLGSFAFHATLTYSAQLADELPMIYLAAFSTYVLFDTEAGWDLWSFRNLSLIAALLAFDVIFTMTYLLYRNPIYHQAMFAFLVLLTGFRVTYLIKWSPKYSIKTPSFVTTPILRMFWTGGALFLLAFGIWNLDNIFCGTLTRWKRYIGSPFTILLEGHSWWHILTAIGTHLMIQGVGLLAICVKDDYRKFTIGTDYGIPYVARKSLAKPAKQT